MQIHIFRGPGRIFGFTTKQAGDNLPQKYACSRKHPISSVMAPVALSVSGTWTEVATVTGTNSLACVEVFATSCPASFSLRQVPPPSSH